MEDNENSALARGLAVLRCIAEARGPVANRDIVGQTGIPKATASRITAQLMAANLLRHEPNGDRYSLGPGVLDLSRAFLEPLDARAAVRNHLREFAEAAGISVHLGLRDGLDMVVVETVRPRSAAVVTRLDIGSRMPVASSAMGRAWLAGLDAREQQAMLEVLVQAGGSSPAARAGVEEAVADIDSRGFCASFGDYSPEVNAIGTWLRWPNGELYALSCGGTAYRLPPELLSGAIADRLGAALTPLCRDSGASCPLVPAQPLSTLRVPPATQGSQPRKATA